MAEKKLVKKELYKTELCRHYVLREKCPYRDKCQFAHGWKEVVDVARHPKYKTELCKRYHSTGFCPYGYRCHFIHDDQTKSTDPVNGQGQQDKRFGHRDDEEKRVRTGTRQSNQLRDSPTDWSDHPEELPINWQNLVQESSTPWHGCSRKSPSEMSDHVHGKVSSSFTSSSSSSSSSPSSTSPFSFSPSLPYNENLLSQLLSLSQFHDLDYRLRLELTSYWQSLLQSLEYHDRIQLKSCETFIPTLPPVLNIPEPNMLTSFQSQFSSLSLWDRADQNQSLL